MKAILDTDLFIPGVFWKEQRLRLNWDKGYDTPRNWQTRKA